MKCDGRTYRCDIRSTRLRLMAGGYQRDLDTKVGEWIDVEAPFDQCDANSVGRRVQNAPALNATSIESVGITLADKKEEALALLGWFVGHWGGLTPPRFQNELYVVNPATPACILLQLAVISLAFLPWLGGAVRRAWMQHRGIVVACAFACLLAAAVPVTTADLHVGRFSGWWGLIERARDELGVSILAFTAALLAVISVRGFRGEAVPPDAIPAAEHIAPAGVVRRDAVIEPSRVPALGTSARFRPLHATFRNCHARAERGEKTSTGAQEHHGFGVPSIPPLPPTASLPSPDPSLVSCAAAAGRPTTTR
jgi:hypothetical protein